MFLFKGNIYFNLMKKELNDFDIMRMAYMYGKIHSKYLDTQYGAFIYDDKKLISCGVYSPDESFSSQDSDVENLGYINAEIIAMDKLNLEKISRFSNFKLYMPFVPGNYSAMRVVESKIGEVVVHKELNDFLSSSAFSEHFKLNQKSGLIVLESEGVKIKYLEGKLFPDCYKIKFRGREFSP